MSTLAKTGCTIPNKYASFRVGCVGGGQLGRMMAIEAPRLNISMSFLDPMGKKCPAAYSSAIIDPDSENQTGNKIIEGRLDDAEKLAELAKGCDVVTMEIEHVGVEGLRKLEEKGVNVQPSSRVIEIIQDKYKQKKHFESHKIPLPPFVDCPSTDSIKSACVKFGTPIMLKSKKGAYDGRGNAVLENDSDEAIQEALKALGATDKDGELELYAEGWINYSCEVAVMVVRSITGETKSYPAVTAIQQDSICRVVLVPAQNVSQEIQNKCKEIASMAIDSLGDGATGIFGVELFLDESGKVLLNEVAPRPHNTGHYTQDACAVSQFEHHLRAVTGLSLGNCELAVGSAAMVNVLGAASGKMEDTINTMNESLSIPNATVHWYGKDSCRKGRKMGHVNLTAASYAELEESLHQILDLEDIPRSILSTSNSAEKSTSQSKSVLVGVIMGSTSDLPTMQAAVDILRAKFNIPCEVDVVSAHRTPDKLMKYAREAAGRGIQVIIAGAGGAAHLPGMIASMTPLPVIGVPIKTSTLNGQDSLLSIVQMPRGIPVATVAIGNATNAGLLAVRILAATRPQLRSKMEEYQTGMREMVEGTSDDLLRLGSEKYLEGMANKSTSVNV